MREWVFSSCLYGSKAQSRKIVKGDTRLALPDTETRILKLAMHLQDQTTH